MEASVEWVTEKKQRKKLDVAATPKLAFGSDMLTCLQTIWTASTGYS